MSSSGSSSYQPASSFLWPVAENRGQGHQGGRKLDKNEKMLRSPFGIYMAEQRPKLDREGISFQGWKAVADYLTPQWKLMTDDEKSYYKGKSEEVRGVESREVPKPPPIKKQVPASTVKPKYDIPSGFTTFGEKIITSHVEVMIEYKEYMSIRSKIESFLQMNIGGKARAIQEKGVVVLEFNPYCSDITGTGDIIPGEWAMASFNLTEGIKSVACGLIDPGVTPPGTASEINENVKSLGLRPLGFDRNIERDNSEVEEETDVYLALVEEIKEMLELNHRENYNLGYIFTMRDDVPLVQRCLSWLYKKAGKSLDVEVLPLSVLMELYSSLNPTDIRYALTEVESDRILNKITFAYDTNLSCDWHLTEDRINLLDKCVRNVVMRSMYNLFGQICPIYGVEMIVPEHSPAKISREAMSMQQQGSRQIFAAPICAEREKKPKVLSLYSMVTSICSQHSPLSDHEGEGEGEGAEEPSTSCTGESVTTPSEEVTE